MSNYQKLSGVFRTMIPISIGVSIVADIILEKNYLWLEILSLVVLIVAAIGIYVCENRLLGIKSEKERRELWRPHRGYRNMKIALFAVLLVLFYMAYLR